MSRVNGANLRFAVAGILAIAFDGQVASAADAPTTLEEILITAEKRVGTVQETPISIAAFSGNELADRGVNDSYGLANLTPSLSVGKEFIGKVVIRGVGLEGTTVGSDPGVAIHRDGAYVARSSVALFDFFDVNRIEVLRGPQGTLYGRNATGGVINILSNEPDKEFGGYARLDVGNYAKLRFEGALNGPLGDRAQGRLSVLYGQRDGYTENLFPSAKSRDVDQLDNQDLFAVRGQVNFDLNDDVSLLLSAELTRDDSNTPAYKYFDTTNAWWFNAFGNDQDLPDLRQVSQGFETEIPGSGRSMPSAGQADQDAYLASLTWNLDNMTFTSLSAYRSIDYAWLNDGDGFDTFFVQYGQHDESDQFTQEFRLASRGDSKLQWILGAYYLKEDAKTFMAIPFILGTPADYIMWDGKSDTEGYALFGQATYAFTDRLRLTAGLRYNKEEKQGDLAYNVFGGLVEPPGALGEPAGTTWADILDDSWDAITPKLALDYDFTDDIMGYASITRGFKSGGFNLLAAQYPYDQETLWAYELGVKTRLADGRVIANFGAFMYDYKDMQVGQIANLTVAIVNAGAATIQGLEAEVRALVGTGFEVNAGLSWLDATYDSFETEDPGWPGYAGCGTLVEAPRTISLDGCDLPRSPEFQGVLGVSGSHALANGGNVSIRGDYSHRSKQFFTQFNRDIVSQGSYGLVNARVSYAAPESRWSVSAYGNNLADEDYFVTVFESGVSVPGTVVPGGILGAPRTYGLALEYNF